MRLFIAVTFGDDVKTYLEDVKNAIKPSIIKGKFTHYNNFHITLKYIGVCTTTQYDSLCEIIDTVTGTSNPFSIQIGDIGSFYKKNKYILFVKVTENTKYLASLFQKIESVVEEYDFKKDIRKYRPHITLGREIILHISPANILIPSYEKEIPINSISLMLSSRVDGVLTYTPLYTKKLTKAL